MATTGKLMTAEEFVRIPDDGYRYELIRGELRKMAAASFDHGVYASRIVETLLPFVRGNRLGEVPLPSQGFCWEQARIMYASQMSAMCDRSE